jgi:phosphate-selective porin OprO and OprP
MKNSYLKKLLILIAFFLPISLTVHAQTDDLLNVLIKKNVITQQEADSIRADAAVKAQAKKDQDAKSALPGVGFGKYLRIGGVLQERYQGFEQSTKFNSFDIHRARLIIQGNVTDDWSYYTQTELSGGSVKAVDIYTTYKIADYLKFSAGQMKIPFSLESLTSDPALEFIDRSQVVEALAGRSTDVLSTTGIGTAAAPGNQQGRDIGIQINGSFFKLNNTYLFDYTFGVFNGAGYDVTGDNNSRKDLGGRLAIHPINNLVIGADFYNGVAWYGNPAKNQKRNRGGFDARYVIGGLSVQAEYDKGTDGSIKRDGYYGQAAYFVLPKKLQLAAKYDSYDPNKAIGTDRANIYTGGVNYFFNNWAKFTVDYLIRHEETTTQIKNNILEAQLQLTF